MSTLVSYIIRPRRQTIELAGTAQLNSRTTFLAGFAQSQHGNLSAHMLDLPWEQRVTFARAAAGSWSDEEGAGTAVEIVRRLRDEWD